MGCRKVQALGPLVAAAVVVASGVAEAAWWKGLNWSKDGSLNNDYWEGFGISYETWYSAGGHDSIDAARWESEEAIFEHKDTRYTVSLSNDFACRNVTAFQGVTGGQMTMDLNGHEFSTVHGSWGFFFKGTDGDIVLKNGTISILKAFNVGDDNGCGNTLTLQSATLAWPEAVAVGRGTSTGNSLVVDEGGLVVLEPSHSCWGITVGQNPGENGNSLVVRNGGIVTNTAASMFIGRNTSGNLLVVEGGGKFYRSQYMHLANVGEVEDTSAVAPSGNAIVVTGVGSEAFVDSHFIVGDGVSSAHTALGNRVEVSDGGIFRVANDFLVRSNGNDFAITNGVILVQGGGFRLGDNGSSGNSLTVAGKSPWLRTSYDFSAINGSKLKFVIPAGGYSKPACFDEYEARLKEAERSTDGGYDYVPVTAGVFFTIDSTVTLEIDALEFSKSIMHATTIPLIRGCGYGNAAGISAETIAAWNENLPDGCTVSLLEFSPNPDWGQKTLMLTVKPYNNGMKVMIR